MSDTRERAERGSEVLLPDAPVACTLDGGGMRSRLEEFRVAFRQGFLGAERIGDGFRWRFARRAGLEEHLRALAERERACCPFFRFDLFPAEAGREIWWETRARAEAAPVLEELSRLPEELGTPGATPLLALQTAWSDRLG